MASSISAALRNAFIALIEDDRAGDQEPCRLIEQLLPSTDALPQEYCEMLELEVGSTFGDAARKVRADFGCAEGMQSDA